MKKFCHNCGSPMSKLDAKFCPDCGTKLDSLATTPTPPKPVMKTFVPIGSDNSDDEDTLRVDRVESLSSLGLNLNRLEFDIKQHQATPENVGGLMAQADGKPPVPLQDKQIPVISNEQVLQDFQREAGSLRK